jgi:hypothetical protein
MSTLVARVICLCCAISVPRSHVKERIIPSGRDWIRRTRRDQRGSYHVAGESKCCDLAIQSISSWSCLIADFDSVEPLCQLLEEFLYLNRGRRNCPPVPDLTVPAIICNRSRQCGLGRVKPNENYFFFGLHSNPPKTKGNTMFSPTGVSIKPHQTKSPCKRHTALR